MGRKNNFKHRNSIRSQKTNNLFQKQLHKNAYQLFKKTDVESTHFEYNLSSTNYHPLYIFFTLMVLTSCIIQQAKASTHDTPSREGNYKIHDSAVQRLPENLPYLSSRFAINTSVVKFIEEQKIIRVISDNGPGYGNQAASFSVVVLLRQLGFKGCVEFVYPDTVTDKITMLFNLPSQVGDVYDDPNQNIRFIKLKHFVTKNKNNKINRVSLGVTGGFFPPPCEIAKGDGADVSDDGSIFCENMANFLDTQWFIRLNPYYWGPTDTSRTITNIYEINEKRGYAQPGSGGKFFNVPFSSFTQAKYFLENDPTGQKLMLKKPALKSLITTMESQSANIFPVYGKTILTNGHSQDSTFPYNILEMIMAARYAQINGPSNFNKPLIMSVFYDYSNESSILMDLINKDNWGKYENPNSKDFRLAIKNLGLRDVLTIADIENPDTTNVIQTLQPGHILLLSLGTLPKNVFDGIYNAAGTNIWPPIREGANSFNTLAQTGRPHFRCQDSAGNRGWDIGYDLIKDINFKNQLQAFYQIFCHSEKLSYVSDVYKMLGTFIMQAGDATSPLSQYFSYLKNEALNPNNDRLYYGLSEVSKRALSK